MKMNLTKARFVVPLCLALVGPSFPIVGAAATISGGFVPENGTSLDPDQTAFVQLYRGNDTLLSAQTLSLSEPFTFDGIGAGYYYLRAVSDGLLVSNGKLGHCDAVECSDAVGQPFRVGLNDHRTVNIPMSEGAIIEGYVSEENGSPRSSAVVTAYKQEKIVGSATTDASGYYRMSGLLNSPVHVHIFDGLPSVQVTPGSRHDITLGGNALVHLELSGLEQFAELPVKVSIYSVDGYYVKALTAYRNAAQTFKLNSSDYFIHISGVGIEPRLHDGTACDSSCNVGDLIRGSAIDPITISSGESTVEFDVSAERIFQINLVDEMGEAVTYEQQLTLLHEGRRYEFPAYGEVQIPHSGDSEILVFLSTQDGRGLILANGVVCRSGCPLDDNYAALAIDRDSPSVLQIRTSPYRASLYLDIRSSDGLLLNPAGVNIALENVDGNVRIQSGAALSIIPGRYRIVVGGGNFSVESPAGSLCSEGCDLNDLVGTAEWVDLGVGQQNLQFELDRYQGFAVSIPPGHRSTGFPVWLTPSGVRDERIELSSEMPGVPYVLLVSERNSRFQQIFGGPPCGSSCNPSSEGFSEHAISFEPGQIVVIEATAPIDAEYSVRIRDEAGERIDSYKSLLLSDGVELLGKLGANANDDLVDLPVGEYSILAMADGFISEFFPNQPCADCDATNASTAHRVQIVGGGGELEFTLTDENDLEHELTGDLSGTLWVDGVSSAGFIRIFDQSTAEIRNASVAEDGRFFTSRLPIGEYHVVAYPEIGVRSVFPDISCGINCDLQATMSSLPPAVEIRADEVSDIELEAEQGMTVTAQVVERHDLTRAGDVQVTLYYRWPENDPWIAATGVSQRMSGEVILGGLDAGKYPVSTNGGGTLPENARDREMMVDVTVSSPTVIPVSYGSEVIARAPSESSVYYNATNAGLFTAMRRFPNGIFRSRPLRHDARYAFLAVHPGYAGHYTPRGELCTDKCASLLTDFQVVEKPDESLSLALTKPVDIDYGSRSFILAGPHTSGQAHPIISFSIKNRRGNRVGSYAQLLFDLEPVQGGLLATLPKLPVGEYEVGIDSHPFNHRYLASFVGDQSTLASSEQLVTFSEPELPPIVANIENGYTLAGNVLTEGADRKPVSSGYVVVMDCAGDMLAATRITSGAFRLTGIPAGEFHIVAINGRYSGPGAFGFRNTATGTKDQPLADASSNCIGYECLRLDAHFTVSGDDNDLEVVVRQAPTIAGRLLLAETGLGLSLHKLNLHDTQGTLVAETVTDSRGYFRTTGLRPGSYVLRTTASGLVSGLDTDVMIDENGVSGLEVFVGRDNDTVFVDAFDPRL